MLYQKGCEMVDSNHLLKMRELMMLPKWPMDGSGNQIDFPGFQFETGWVFPSYWKFVEFEEFCGFQGAKSAVDCILSYNL